VEHITAEGIHELCTTLFHHQPHHNTHIEGTRLSLDQAEKILAGLPVPTADPEDARELLNYRSAFEFVSGWLNDGRPITESLIREIHKQLVHIHPFLDGNGRTSRLLSTLVSYRAGYDFKRLFTISEYYDRDRLLSTVHCKVFARQAWI
jgi:Fic family protein